MENVFVKKKDGAKSLILGRGRELLFNRQLYANIG